MTPQEFLGKDGQETVVAAIREAERDTSGEIRVHIDDVCEGDPCAKAAEVFHHIGMDKTALRNGVLIYIACNSKVFAIIGDKGINDAVPAGFWNDVSSHIHDSFAEGRFAEGIADAVKMAGSKLKDYFPFRSGDVNEQPDEISFSGKA